MGAWLWTARLLVTLVVPSCHLPMRSRTGSAFIRADVEMWLARVSACGPNGVTKVAKAECTL